MNRICLLVVLFCTALFAHAQDYTLDGDLTITNKTTVGGDADVNGDLRLPNATQPVHDALRLLYMDDTGVIRTVTPEILDSLQRFAATNDGVGLGCETMYVNPSPQWFSGAGVVYTGQENCYYAPRVGIGTDAPTTQLHVEGGGTFRANASPGATLTVGNHTNDVGLSVNLTEEDPTPNNTAIEVSATGSGSGTTILSLQTDAQSSTLIEATSENSERVFLVEGDGSLWATGVYVRLAQDFPDYVFEEGYELMTLSDLKAYIAEHKHLPGMPSSTEVAEKGANLGEINRLLVEKVEELTLHVIALQEQVEALKGDLGENDQSDKK